MPLFCVILQNLVVSGAHCIKLIDKAITMDNLRLLCLVVDVCRGTARRPRYKYCITARWKFCNRFINSRLNAQYLHNLLHNVGSLFLVFWSTCDIVVKSSRSLSNLLMSSCLFSISTFNYMLKLSCFHPDSRNIPICYANLCKLPLQKWARTHVATIFTPNSTPRCGSTGKCIEKEEGKKGKEYIEKRREDRVEMGEKDGKVKKGEVLRK